MKAIEIFKDIYFSVLKNEFRESESKLKSADRFIFMIENEYCGSIGDYFWYEYICYQFEHYIRNGQDTKNISLNWVFGDKAWRRWVERDKEFWRYWVIVFQNRFCIRFRNSVENIPEELILKYKNAERKRFYNTDQGYLYCTENNLFDPNSRICILCKNFKFCKNE